MIFGYPVARNGGSAGAAESISYNGTKSGLNASNVQDALDLLTQKLYAGDGLAVVVSVVTDDGLPVEGALVTGMHDAIGGECHTDANGIAGGFTDSATPTLGVSCFYDLADTTLTLSGDKGSAVTGEIIVSKQNFRSITSTTTRMFSKLCTRVDITSVGGGGGGAGTDGYYGNVGTQNGGGGAGGYVTVKENVSFEPFTPYLASVGAGGSGNSSGNGGTGGTSSFLGVEAAGGQGGYKPTSSNRNAVAVGNGNGGACGYNTNTSTAPTAGTQTGYVSFTETGTFGGGGGNGQRSTNAVVPGASPYGGDGGRYNPTEDDEDITAAKTGRGPGGGGGGGGYGWTSKDGYDDRVAPAAGYRGVINIRMHH